MRIRYETFFVSTLVNVYSHIGFCSRLPSVIMPTWTALRTVELAGRAEQPTYEYKSCATEVYITLYLISTDI